MPMINAPTKTSKKTPNSTISGIPYAAAVAPRNKPFSMTRKPITCVTAFLRAIIVKNPIKMIANAIASVVFILVSHVNWPAAIAIAVGSVLGAQVGGRVGRRLPATIYRVIIVAVGIAAIVSLVS